MIKRICKNISVIIVGIIIAVIMFKFGQCNRGQPPQRETVYKTDTLIIEKPKVKFKIIERIKWKIAKPETIQVVKYMPWMDSVWLAYSFEQDKKGNINIIMKKDQSVLRKNYQNVPSKWKWYGTMSGDIMRYSRIRWDWFGWNKLTIGTRVYYDRTVVPYLETGIRIKKFNFNIGVDKRSIYADLSYRIW